MISLIDQQQTVIDSIKQEDPNFTGSGYTSLAVIYLVFAAANWLAPSMIALAGPKINMIVGGITYMLVLLDTYLFVLLIKI